MSLIYIDYPTDNNHVSFREARNWLAANRMQSLGLGTGMLIASMIPGVNFISIPASVAAATAYWVNRDK
jgi:CysZ protein